MKDKNIIKFQAFYFLLIGAVGCFTPYINVYLEKSIGLEGSQIGFTYTWCMCHSIMGNYWR